MAIKTTPTTALRYAPLNGFLQFVCRAPGVLQRQGRET